MRKPVLQKPTTVLESDNNIQAKLIQKTKFLQKYNADFIWHLQMGHQVILRKWAAEAQTASRTNMKIMKAIRL